MYDSCSITRQEWLGYVAEGPPCDALRGMLLVAIPLQEYIWSAGWLVFTSSLERLVSHDQVQRECPCLIPDLTLQTENKSFAPLS